MGTVSNHSVHELHLAVDQAYSYEYSLYSSGCSVRDLK